MPMPFAPVEPGVTRDLTSAEWRALAGTRRIGRVVGAIISTVCVGFAAVATYGAVTDRSVSLAISLGLVLVFAVPGATFLNSVYLAAAERPYGRRRRVGRLRGTVGVDRKAKWPTIDGIGVIVPAGWGGLSLGTWIDVEVTPPVASDDSWLRRIALRNMISAHHGGLWIGDLAPGAPDRAGRSAR